MKSLLAASLFVSVVLPASFASAHCQVPCGIYGDAQRFLAMLEDTATITKAIDQIGQLAGTHDATGHNQLARWVANKESHATSIQNTIGEYFLAQRVKADNPRYVDQLKACHAVIVAAMKTKQAADPATAQALQASILDLYRAYTGKEPTQLLQGSANKAAAAAPKFNNAAEYVLYRDGLSKKDTHDHHGEGHQGDHPHTEGHGHDHK